MKPSLSMRVTPTRTKIILDELFHKYFVSDCAEYGEPGYSNPAAGVLFGDWNEVPKWIPEYLEAAGFECEWDDEWLVADNGKAYRTRANSYDWQSSILVTEDGAILTPDDSVSDWLHWIMIHSPTETPRCVPEWITPEMLAEEGFIQYPDEDTHFETGWHPGQNDDPRFVAKRIFETIEDVNDVVFRLAEQSQFYIRWQAFYRLPD